MYNVHVKSNHLFYLRPVLSPIESAQSLVVRVCMSNIRVKLVFIGFLIRIFRLAGFTMMDIKELPVVLERYVFFW